MNLIKIELKQSLTNKVYLICLFVMIGISIATIPVFVHNYNEEQRLISMSSRGYNPLYQASTAYNLWIGGESASLSFALFFFLIPVVATLPYGWSYVSELKTGQISNIITRSTRKKYYIAKYISVFISGGICITLPLLINFMCTSMFFPMITPSISYNMYHSVGPETFLSKLYYTKPYLYVIIYLIIDFVFGGALGALTLAISYKSRNIAISIVFPLFCCLVIHYLRTFLVYKIYIELSPIYFLHASPVINSNSGLVIFGELLILLILEIYFVLIRGPKHDIF